MGRGRGGVNPAIAGSEASDESTPAAVSRYHAAMPKPPRHTPVPGLIFAAPASGMGKTIVVLAFLRWLREQRLRAAPFKVGPDYIDAAFHGAMSGRDCVNLDLWAMRPATLDALIAGLAREADLIVGEGVMGLFDDAGDGTGSTADLAALTGWPVVLVVDAGAMAASAAALVAGFVRHREDVAVAGVLFNRVAGAAHGEILRRACAEAGLPPVLGCLPRDRRLALAERHLGQAEAIERRDLALFADAAAAAIGDHVDWRRLCDLARPAADRFAAAMPAEDAGIALPPLGQRIAVARDDAFAFAYPWVLDGWRRAGAEILPFSPLADEAPDGAADAVYLPGGYPETYAARLAANRRYAAGLRKLAARRVVIYGECGGYMAMGRGLIDAKGEAHEMLGLVPLETSFADRRLHLGYRRVVLRADGPLGAVGAAFRGHEFHYGTIVDEPKGAPLFACADATGRARAPAGFAHGSIMGSFIHLMDRDDAAGADEDGTGGA